jgi:ribonucleoside-diphosphate reductase alpha chain
MKGSEMAANLSPMGAPAPVKFPLDDERFGTTVKFQFDEENKGYFVINTYEDGVPGELTIFMGKIGEFERGFANSWAIAVSMLLQHGVDPRIIYGKFKHMAFEPAGITGVVSVPMASSLVDLIVKYMEGQYPPTGGPKAKSGLDDYDDALKSLSG